MTGSWSWHAGAAGLGMLLSALVPTVAFADETGSGQRQLCQDPAELSEIRDATQFVGLHSCWEADESNQKYQNLNDLYVHWSVERLEGGTYPADVKRQYRREDRSWLSRLLAGKSLSFIGSVRIDMHNPDLTFTIPLATFGYEGKAGKGQTWTTDIVSDDQAQAFFRVTPTTMATFSATAKSTETMDVRATSTVLKAIKGVASVVGPGGPLLTTLNGEVASSLATKVDDALQSVWSHQQGEQQISGRSLSEWYPGSYMLVKLVMPEWLKSDTGDGGGFTRYYKLMLSCPRYSIFLAKQTCRTNATSPTDPSLHTAGDNTTAPAQMGYLGPDFQAAVKEARWMVSADQVLNFPLSSQKTVLSLITEQTWYQQFVGGNSASHSAAQPQQAEVAGTSAVNVASDVTTTSATRTSEDYTGFCTSTVNLLYRQGLSAWDSRLALWSLVTATPGLRERGTKFQQNAACLDRLPDGAKGGLWKYDGNDTVVAAPARKGKRR